MVEKRQLNKNKLVILDLNMISKLTEDYWILWDMKDIDSYDVFNKKDFDKNIKNKI